VTYSILLGGGNLLDGESVVEQAVAREVLAHILLHELNTEIKVVDTLDLVADTADCKITHSHQHQLKWKDDDEDVLSFFCFLAWSTDSRGVKPVSRASENMDAASSRAPPNRLPVVKRPEANDEMRSLPARVATMVFIAPDTARPWSAVSMRTISMNMVTQGGRPGKRTPMSKRSTDNIEE
jgi:hypothetical protein